VIRTVGSTGGVITSAGLIFAASMFGLTASSISNIVQVGFIIGVGLLLDTFVVRTITVPAMAVLVGKANWWPSRPPTKQSDAQPEQDDADELVSVAPVGRTVVDYGDVT
jgi:RND superfamily putative drug exporter